MLPRHSSILRSFARSESRRSYAVLADARSTVNYIRKGDQPAQAPNNAITVTTAQSGIKLATVDTHGPASSLAIVVSAGSRHEKSDKPGVAQFLKNTLIRNSPGDNAVRVLLDTQLRGNTLVSAHTREEVILSTSFLRDDLVDAVPLLLQQFLNTEFESFEFLDRRPFVIEESAANLASPIVQISEKLHELSFRSGLGNGLYASANAFKSLKRSDIHDFTSKHFSGSRIAIIGKGVDHEDLDSVLTRSLGKLNIPASTDAPAEAAKFYGGEARIRADGKGLQAFGVSLAGVGITDSLYPAQLVAKAILGPGARVKWGNCVEGTLGAVSPKSTINAFQNAYSDIGILGFLITSSTPSEANSALKKSVEVYKALAENVSDEALKRGKAAAIVDFETAMASEESVVNFGRFLLKSGKAMTIKSISDAIQSVTAADVKKVLSKSMSSKPAVLAYGNTQELIFADQL